MPSLARVMPATSVFISRFLPPSHSASVARRAILGVAVAVILEHFLDDLGLEFSVRTLGDLGQVKILDRIAVGVELEAAAQRGEVGFLQCRRDCILVAEIALYCLHRAV